MAVLTRRRTLTTRPRARPRRLRRTLRPRRCQRTRRRQTTVSRFLGRRRFATRCSSADPLASDPECVKVKDWRHKLQRAFLGKGLPSATVSPLSACGAAADAQEMDQYNDVFNSIEAYKDMTIEALQYSKIGKGEFQGSDQGSRLTDSHEEDCRPGRHPAKRRAEDHGASSQADGRREWRMSRKHTRSLIAVAQLHQRRGGRREDQRRRTQVRGAQIGRQGLGASREEGGRVEGGERRVSRGREEGRQDGGRGGGLSKKMQPKGRVEDSGGRERGGRMQLAAYYWVTSYPRPLPCPVPSYYKYTTGGVQPSLIETKASSCGSQK